MVIPIATHHLHMSPNDAFNVIEAADVSATRLTMYDRRVALKLHRRLERHLLDVEA